MDISVDGTSIAITQCPKAQEPTSQSQVRAASCSPGVLTVWFAGKWEESTKSYLIDTGLFAGGAFKPLEGGRGRIEVFGSGVAVVDYEGDLRRAE